MSRCLSSKITFDTSTLEKIVFDPDSILENEDDFWENERAQKLTQTWSHIIKYSIDFDKWRKELKKWAALPLEVRESQTFFKNAKKILNNKERIIDGALRHICQFLPQDADLDVTIRFTAFIPARCFANEDIIFNLNADYWKDNVENTINSVVHEIFHVGYSYCRSFHRDPLKDRSYNLFDQLISEGISTYVAYKALNEFPAPDEKDYKMLEDENEVKRLISDINSILSKINEISEEELNDLLMEKCIKGRAYYIPGAYVCKVIDEKLGRQKLIDLLLLGPISIISQYDNLNEDEDFEIHI